jgi:hypothetical protein
MMGLGAWLRIVQSSDFLPLEPAINWVPSPDFSSEVVSEALRRFPQFDDVATSWM